MKYINFKKITILLLMIFITGLFFVSCRRKKDPNEVIDVLKELKSYSTDVKMTVYTGKQTIQYEMKQYYLKDFGYRLELGKDRTLLYKKDNIYLNDKVAGKRYVQERTFDDVYHLSFIGDYIGMLYTNEEVKLTFKDINKIQYLAIETPITSDNRNTSKAVMYVDLTDYSPYKIFIYDYKNNLRSEFEFSNFKSNIKIPESTFNNW